MRKYFVRLHVAATALFAAAERRVDSFWRSDRASIYGLISFLSGAAGMTSMALLHLPSGSAQVISGICMILGALLITPKDKSAE